jgi:hypothetical protein
MVMKKVLALLALLAAGCADRILGPERSDPDAIQIAFFAEIIAEQPSEAASAYCLSTGDWQNPTDPSEDVMADMRSLYGKAQPASACVITVDNITFNGLAARAFHIVSAVQVDNTATVTGFAREGAVDRARYQARVDKQGRLWVVTEMELLDQPSAN